MCVFNSDKVNGKGCIIKKFFKELKGMELTNELYLDN